MFKRFYNRLVIFLIGLFLKPVSFLLRFTKPVTKEPAQIDENRLGLLLLREGLEEQKDLIGLADLNDFKISKRAILKEIQQEQYQRSAALEARGYIGTIRRASTVEEDFICADYATDPKVLAALQREKESCDLSKALKAHWADKYYGTKSEAQWDIDHKAMIDRMAVLAEEEDRARNSWRFEEKTEVGSDAFNSLREAVFNIEEELDLKPGKDS